MHRIFKEALKDATGVLQFIIAVIIDIRGFSAFSTEVDSAETAMFIKRVYTKLIDSYFPFASFYKSTGDGLVLIIPWDENNLAEVLQRVIASCINCHSEFGSMWTSDPVIYFKVPDRIGIGVARGTACCLVSAQKTIDYSGRLLNLTSRLCDLARPSGIVVDGGFGITLLSDEQRAYFEEDNNVYLRGIAEARPTRIYFTPEFTVIQEYNKRPIAQQNWVRKTDTKLYGDLLKLTDFPFAYYLETQPLSPKDIRVQVEHLQVIEGKVNQKYKVTIHFEHFTFRTVGGRNEVRVDFAKLCQRLKEHHVKEDMEITISVVYRLS